MIAFSSLLSVERGWTPVWLLFTAFAAALVAARLFFGHLPDKLGGARVALISAVIEAIGLALIWLAPSLSLAAAGALLTGFGYALVYPALVPKLSVVCRQKAAASLWGLTAPSWISHLGSVAQR